MSVDTPIDTVYPAGLPTPEEMPGWFMRLGVRARQGGFVDVLWGRVVGCCALGAVYMYKTKWMQRGDARELQCITDDETRRAILRLTPDEDLGIVMGFDGESALPPEGASPEFRSGYAWGAAVWSECVAAGVAAAPRS